MGYDISNYRDIDKWYGTLDDWEAVKDAVHERGMKLVMDLVVNHTSDQVCSICLIVADFSTLGSKSLARRSTTQRETGTSGSQPRPTKRARKSRPTTGGLPLESECSMSRQS
jgi:alpha-glucosidase